MALAKFITKHKADKNKENYTHTVMAPFNGIQRCSFHASGTDLDEFYNLYEADVKRSIVPGITEKHLHAGPILIDLDFRYNDSVRRYNTTHIHNFVEKLMTIIRSYIQGPKPNQTIYKGGIVQVYVLEKPRPKPHKDLFKDGVHIVIPTICTLPDAQEAIRDEFLNTFPDYFASLSTSEDADVYDKKVIYENGWLMYGSKKADDVVPFYLSHILHVDEENQIIKDEAINDIGFKRLDLIKLLSIRNKCQTVQVDQAKVEVKKNKEVITPQKQQKGNTPPNPQDTEYALAIVDILSGKRANGYNDWMAVGWCLYNIEHGPIKKDDDDMMPIGLQKWIEFSKRSKKYTSGECERLWDSMKYKPDGYKLGSLITWGREDAPEKMKELEKKFKMPESLDEIRGNTENYTYTTIKQLFEKRVAWISEEDIFVVEKKSIITDDKFKFTDDVALRKKHRALKCKIRKGNSYIATEFIPLWFKDEMKRTYDECAFLPPPIKCAPNVYNTWCGFGIDRLNIESSNNIEPFLRHVGNLTNNIQDHTEYFLNWLAQMVQEPGKKIAIAIVITSAQGTGKNMFLYGLRDMLGSDLYRETSNPLKDIFGQFANFRLNRLLINIDEAQAKDSFQCHEGLKNLVSTEVFNYEKKGVDPIPCFDFSRLIFTSNNDLVVKIEATDRRYVVFEASSAHVKDQKYFDDLHDYFQDKRNLKAIMAFLRSRDIGKVNWKDRPISEAYKNMMHQCTDPVLRFLEWIYIDNMKDSNSFALKPTKLLEVFLDFCRNNMNFKEDAVRYWSGTKFGTVLRKYIDEAPTAISKVSTKSGSTVSKYYMFSKEPMHNFLIKYNLLRETAYMFVD